MRYAVVLALLVFSACKGPKGEQGSAGPAGAPAPNNQADLLVFEGSIAFDPHNVFVGALGDDRIVLTYLAISGFPNDWIQLGYPTGDNATTLDPWASINTANGQVTIHNGAAGDLYKIFVIPVNMLSSFRGLPDRFEVQ